MVDRVSRRLTTFSDEREISGSIPVLGCSARRLAGHNLWVRRYGERKQPPFQPQEDAANLRAVNTVVLVLDSMSGFRGRGTRTTTRRTRTDTPSSGRTPDEYTRDGCAPRNQRQKRNLKEPLRQRRAYSRRS